MPGELRVQLSEVGADEERLASLTGHLRAALLQLDVADVRALPVGPAPPGTRSFELVAAGGLLITLGKSVDALRAVVSAIGTWLDRDKATRKIRLEIDGSTLELSEATARDQERLIQMFIDRHAHDGGPS
jgi:hypothetical protein